MSESPGIYLPLARMLHVPSHVARMAQRTAFAQARQDLDDLSQRYRGRADTPAEPIYLYMPDGSQTLIVGGGVTEVAELQEMAEAAMEQAEATMARTGRAVDIDEFRERRGLPPREKVDGMIRQAMADRIARHKANPISDPERNIWKQLAKGQSMVTVPARTWKGDTDGN